ncbi:hypothetical protein ANCCAN_04263 [Ancylostoma caninum]|uniref:Uncharacterized protein n=1 Tax=Ancylostoma caninum TaxID=29170 RepID=A0A368H1Z7_ANCCA|nr:hypothetical protein ANCCAN_04263 [Ancylostoma caninum]
MGHRGRGDYSAFRGRGRPTVSFLILLVFLKTFSFDFFSCCFNSTCRLPSHFPILLHILYSLRLPTSLPGPVWSCWKVN